MHLMGHICAGDRKVRAMMVEEKHSLGGWGCVVHSGNVSREFDNIQLCSRETSRTQT